MDESRIRIGSDTCDGRVIRVACYDSFLVCWLAAKLVPPLVES